MTFWSRFLARVGFHALVWTGSLGAATAFASDAPDPAAVAAKVKEIFRSRCYECHGGSAVQADIHILNAQEMLEAGTVVAKLPDESRVYQVLVTSDEDARMPLELPALEPNEIEWVRQWIVGGAVDFPADVSVSRDPADAEKMARYRHADYPLQQILQHQRSMPLSERNHFRYFSTHHLLTGGATQAELQSQRDALYKAIHHLSRERRMVRPVVVNPEIATLFAVDLRDLGWHRAVARSSTDKGTPTTLNAFDLVLLEYPYGVIYKDSETYDALATEFLIPSHMVRPIPSVRADWFTSIATQPPLYHDLLQLPTTLAALEKQLGIDSQDNITQRIAKRAGMAVSGVSRNNRAVERHPSTHGAYWKSVDYASSKGSENIFADPMHLVGAGGEMIFNLPNGLQAYYIADAAGERLNFAPTSIVTDKFAQDKTVRNGLSCIRCHEQGIKNFRDEVRPAIEKITGGGLIDKRATLEVYPPREEMSELVMSDQRRFLDAVEMVLGGPQTEEPLTAVSKRFLDAPLHLSAVAGELGYANPEELRVIVRQPHLAGLGLVTLANAGVIRRDTWEDYYDRVVTALGLGVPVIPIDSLTRPDYLPTNTRLDVRLKTTKANNIFAPGDELAIEIENRGVDDVFIELLGRSSAGEVASILPAGTHLAAGKTLRFPESGFLKVKPALGSEHIILYASRHDFPAAAIARGENVADRIVHPFYKLTREQSVRLEHDARDLIKRTLTIETR